VGWLDAYFGMSQTRVLSVDAAAPDTRVIRQAADLIRQGGLVAFPTETVYGLGANAHDAEAVARIFSAKNRPATDPVIVHIADLEQITEVVASVPDEAFVLAELFWPGPLTLILPCHDQIPRLVTAGGDFVGVRMPAHPVARALIAEADMPIAAPSANSFSRPSATQAEHVLEDLDGRIDAILDAGPTPIGVESTVLDLTGAAPTILRPGGVTMEALRTVLPLVTLRQRLTDSSSAEVAPGQLIRHYSPRASVMLFRSEADISAMNRCIRAAIESGKRVGVIGLEQQAGQFALEGTVWQPLGRTLEDAAHLLFAAFRALDAAAVDVIVMHGYGGDGLGAALWDRMLRAAEGQIQQEENKNG
jgi:L-threonylcarbamoyladenylate synthase